jgi:hypothetical protein
MNEAHLADFKRDDECEYFQEIITLLFTIPSPNGKNDSIVNGIRKK